MGYKNVPPAKNGPTRNRFLKNSVDNVEAIYLRRKIQKSSARKTWEEILEDYKDSQEGQVIMLARSVESGDAVAWKVSK